MDNWQLNKGNLTSLPAELLARAFIIDDANINIQDFFKNTQLHIAIIRGGNYAKEILEKKGTDINIRNIDGNTPLHLTIITNNKYLLKLLIKKGADVNIKNNFGNTALHLAIKHDYLKLAKQLLEAGANILIQNNKGQTPFYLAATKDNREILDLFITTKALAIGKTDYETLRYVSEYIEHCQNKF